MTTFHAGDIVLHSKTGERWSLALDEHDGHVSPCGWPECMAKAADCTLLTAATDEQRRQMMTVWAETVDDPYRRSTDHRISTAKHQLHLWNSQPTSPS